MVSLRSARAVVFAQAGTPTPTPTPFDSTAVSSPEFATVVATAFAVIGVLVLFARLRKR